MKAVRLDNGGVEITGTPEELKRYFSTILVSDAPAPPATGELPLDVADVREEKPDVRDRWRHPIVVWDQTPGGSIQAHFFTNAKELCNFYKVSFMTSRITAEEVSERIFRTLKAARVRVLSVTRFDMACIAHTFEEAGR